MIDDQYSVSYAGQAGVIQPALTTDSYHIGRAATTLDAVVVAPPSPQVGQSVTLSSTLTLSGPGTPVAGEAVEFSLTQDGFPSISCIGVTTSAGHAACSLTAPAGAYNVGAEYAGNIASRLASSSSGPPVTFTPVSCAAGSWSADGHEPCVPASTGHYVDAPGATGQAECAPGTYQDATGASSCESADVGHFVDSAGAVSEAACVPGSYQSATGSASCVVAQPGYYVPGAGASSQILCPAGSTSTVPGAIQCVLLDTTAPTVTNVTSTTADGFYRAGSTLAVTVTFSEQVIVTGTPQLALNSGATGTYSSGSGTNTLVFVYTVAAGQNSADLDSTSTSALMLNGGSIKDAANNPATLTLPTPGAAGSLGANKNIVIDTTPPTVAYAGNTGSYTVDQQVNITCTAADTVGGSGLASQTCQNIVGPAAGLGLGSHSYTATATDKAGNVRSTSTSFTVTVTPASLCTLTLRYTDSSAIYARLSAGDRAAFDKAVTALCSADLNPIKPTIQPAQKKILIGLYKAGLKTFATSGWLTTAQTSQLSGLADSL